MKREREDVEFVSDCRHRDCCEKNLERYTRGQELGHGFFGKIYTCQDGQCKEETYVIKVINRGAGGGYLPGYALWNEVDIQYYLHANGVSVPKIFDAWSCDDLFYIVMQKLEGYTLSAYLKSPSTLPHFETLMMRLFEQINRMNLLGVAHNDLHGSNVYFNVTDNTFYIIDFGVATFKAKDKIRNGDADSLLDSIYRKRNCKIHFLELQLFLTQLDDSKLFKIREHVKSYFHVHKFCEYCKTEKAILHCDKCHGGLTCEKDKCRAAFESFHVCI